MKTKQKLIFCLIVIVLHSRLSDFFPKNPFERKVSQIENVSRFPASETNENDRLYEFKSRLIDIETNNNMNFYQFQNDMKNLFNEYHDVLTDLAPESLMRPAVDNNGTPLIVTKDLTNAEYLIENRFAFLSFGKRSKDDDRELELRKSIAILNEFKKRFPNEFEKVQYSLVSGYAYGDCGSREPGVCRPKSLIDHLKKQLKAEGTPVIKEEMIDLIPNLDLDPGTIKDIKTPSANAKDACKRSYKKILAAVEEQLLQRPTGQRLVFSGEGAVNRNLYLSDINKIDVSMEYQGARVSSLSIQCITSKGEITLDILNPKHKGEFIDWINKRRTQGSSKVKSKSGAQRLPNPTPPDHSGAL